MESTVKKQHNKSVRRAFLLGALSTLIVISAWNAIPESGEHWVIKVVVFGAHIFYWLLLAAFVFKFCSTIWKWLTR